jgi:hypothetical protein
MSLTDLHTRYSRRMGRVRRGLRHRGVPEPQQVRAGSVGARMTPPSAGPARVGSRQRDGALQHRVRDRDP